EPVRRIAHRSNERELVRDLREPRKELRHVHAGHFRRDRWEDALDVVGTVLLRIPKIEMARAALEIDEDDALRFPPAGAAAARRLARDGASHREELREAQTEKR